MRYPVITILACALSTSALADPPKPAPPKDEDVDALLQSAKPAAPGKSEPLPNGGGDASPLKPKSDNPQGWRPGVITLSDGEKVKGRLATTLDQPIRVYDPERKEYRDVPWPLIKSIEAKVLWERDEREWAFRQSGSDIKVYSGKTYPARETAYTVTLADGKTVTGSIAAPIYLETAKDPKTFILHKRAKGDVGQTLKQLAYVARVELE
ncbi:MAG: hypothetical protein ACAI43_04370 [Phycisphaerae bacterium]